MSVYDLKTNSRVMVVDDEPANLRVVGRMLKQAGYPHVTLVQDSRKVLETYSSMRFDLILLDINMPNLDGFEVLKLINEQQDPLQPPVVFLTAQDQQRFKLQALELGAHDFIGKPFDMTELLMRVRNLLQAQLSTRLLHDQKSTLEEMVRQRTEELYNSRLEVIQRLGKAAEYKDEETGNHALRVGYTASLIARALGRSEVEVDMIFHAAPMHDIGKIGIPDNILLKPGKLDPDEWQKMQTHTLIGGELLEGEHSSDLLLMAREIALSHHEKWNGEGYPNGLAGEDIPWSGRVVAVADVFDALTSERPYKRVWTVSDAVGLIKNGRGVHFDPAVVDAFLDNLDKILAFKESHH